MKKLISIKTDQVSELIAIEQTEGQDFFEYLAAFKATLNKVDLSQTNVLKSLDIINRSKFRDQRKDILKQNLFRATYLRIGLLVSSVEDSRYELLKYLAQAISTPSLRYSQQGLLARTSARIGDLDYCRDVMRNGDYIDNETKRIINNSLTSIGCNSCVIL